MLLAVFALYVAVFSTKACGDYSSEENITATYKYF